MNIMLKLFRNCHYWSSVTCYSQRSSWESFFSILDTTFIGGWSLLTLFRMGIFGVVHGWGRLEPKSCPLPKTCHTYLAVMKHGTVPYLNKIHIWITWHTFWVLLTSALLSPEICKLCYTKKYRYRLLFDT